MSLTCLKGKLRSPTSTKRWKNWGPVPYCQLQSVQHTTLNRTFGEKYLLAVFFKKSVSLSIAKAAMSVSQVLEL